MNPWGLVIGGKRDGKDEALRSIVRSLQALQLRVGGCVQIPVIEGDEIVGYDLLDIRTEERIELARSTSKNPTICDLEFNRASFDRVRDWVAPEADVVVLPVGRIELGEQGHWPAIEESLRLPGRAVILSVRPHLMAPLVLRLSDPFCALELPADTTALQGFAQEFYDGLPSRTSPL